MTSLQPEPTPLEALLERLRATDAEARRILGSRARPELPPLESPADAQLVHAGEMPTWSAVELQLNVAEEIITFVGRDLVTGQPRIKIEMARSDATADWVPWIRRWLERKRRGPLQLVE